MAPVSAPGVSGVFRRACGRFQSSRSRLVFLVPSTDEIARYRANLQGEVDGSAMYRAMAELESQPQRAEIYRRLAAVEESHAGFWRKQLEQAGAAAQGVRPGWRTRLLIWIARRFGPDVVLPTLRTLEEIDRDHYDRQAESAKTLMPAQERSHARVLSRLSGAVRSAWDGASYSSLEGRHGAGGGNALRAAVLGANDGLVSNLSLVMGVAGAAFSQQTVLVTGLAGLAAGACSMAMGEWLSVTSSRELYRKQIATEADELAQVPDEEQEELVLIYQSKGMDRASAEQTAARVMASKDAALDTLVREEIGVNPDDLGGSAWSAAASSFFVFIAGAIFPVVPFFFLGGGPAVIASLALSAAALYAIGAVTSIFTGRSVLFTGLRQVGIGVAAAAITYGLGRVLGVSLS
jgi:vacuolar iron transporter family protein